MDEQIGEGYERVLTSVRVEKKEIGTLKLVNSKTFVGNCRLSHAPLSFHSRKH
jgi:hypothetical protein